MAAAIVQWAGAQDDWLTPKRTSAQNLTDMEIQLHVMSRPLTAGQCSDGALTLTDRKEKTGMFSVFRFTNLTQIKATTLYEPIH
jgi:hypothetical protein